MSTPLTPPHCPASDRALLERMDAKLDRLGNDMDTIKKQAAITGAVAGALSGGVVAVSVAYIKAKMGL